MARTNAQSLTGDLQTFTPDIVQDVDNVTDIPVNGKQLTKGEVAELKSEDRISVLGSELELFWYINEKDMRENSSYPVDIYNTYVIGNIVGKGTFGVVRKGFWKHDGNNTISGYNNNTISGHQGRRSLSSLSTRTS